MEPIPVHNMSKLFNKEILIYSLFDIRFKKPMRIMTAVYGFILCLILGIPIIKIFGVSIYTLAIIIIPSVVLANYMSKPIWGGKSFTSWAKTQIKYIFSLKWFFDGKSSQPLRDQTINHTILVSRRTDFENALALKSLGK